MHVTPFHTHPDSEGGTHNASGVNGELHQAVLISGSIYVIVCFICFDEDRFVWDRVAFPIYKEHLQIKSKSLSLGVACTQCQALCYHQGVIGW